ncbi:MAG: GNAT family N-acetyltransferase [Solobacterium sp.]|nr:GNAT family N-acetyltransferase [Solobacterium sp.]
MAIIAACGNDCSACPRYTAPPYEKTEEQLRHTAELWQKTGYRKTVETIEKIACTGCSTANFCRYGCVQCCTDRGIRTCAECAEYPCARMNECFEVTLSFEPQCRRVCTEEEYEWIRKAFFEKKKNLDVRHVNTASDSDIDAWMKFVRTVSPSFPGLETEQDLREHRETVLRFMQRQEALCVKENSEITGVILFSRKRNMICFLAVSPEHRRKGIGALLLDHALNRLDRQRDITVTTFRAEDERGTAPRALYKKYGFTEGALCAEFGYPDQVLILPGNSGA